MTIESMGHEALDSQVAALGGCCSGNCDQGRDCPLRRESRPALWMVLCALLPLVCIACVAIIARAAQ